jgi:hypothetical protein
MDSASEASSTAGASANLSPTRASSQLLDETIDSFGQMLQSLDLNSGDPPLLDNTIGQQPLFTFPPNFGSNLGHATSFVQQPAQVTAPLSTSGTGHFGTTAPNDGVPPLSTFSFSYPRNGTTPADATVSDGQVPFPFRNLFQRQTTPPRSRSRSNGRRPIVRDPSLTINPSLAPPATSAEDMATSPGSKRDLDQRVDRNDPNIAEPSPFKRSRFTESWMNTSFGKVESGIQDSAQFVQLIQRTLVLNVTDMAQLNVHLTSLYDLIMAFSEDVGLCAVGTSKQECVVSSDEEQTKEPNAKDTSENQPSEKITAEQLKQAFMKKVIDVLWAVRVYRSDTRQDPNHITEASSIVDLEFAVHRLKQELDEKERTAKKLELAKLNQKKHSEAMDTKANNAKSKLNDVINDAESEKRLRKTAETRADKLLDKNRDLEQDKTNISLAKATVDKKFRDLEKQVDRWKEYEKSWSRIKIDYDRLERDYHRVVAERNDLRLFRDAQEDRAETAPLAGGKEVTLVAKKGTLLSLTRDNREGVEESVYQRRCDVARSSIEQKRDAIADVEAQTATVTQQLAGFSADVDDELDAPDQTSQNATPHDPTGYLLDVGVLPLGPGYVISQPAPVPPPRSSSYPTALTGSAPLPVPPPSTPGFQAGVHMQDLEQLKHVLQTGPERVPVANLKKGRGGSQRR